jgi:hypothetical protein
MLPSPPKTMGRLSDVLISALKSVQAQENPLQLPQRRSVVVLLVDGLGSSNLKSAGGHARFLNSQPAEKISCFYPSTTSTSLSSLATGASPNETGFVGYQIFDRDSATPINLLSGWQSQEEAKAFQNLQTVSELARTGSIAFDVVSPAIYSDSGFTAATMRNSEFHGVNTVAERFTKTLDLLKLTGSRVVYLYVPELDQIAHAWGSESTKWLNALEELDDSVRGFVSKLPKGSALLLTADHGVIDVSPDNHLYIDELFERELFDFVGGDTRGLFLYLKTKSTELKTRLELAYGSSCYVVEPQDLIDAGYWTQTEKQEQFLPDYILLAKRNVALYHRGFAKLKSLNMIGHHGSISAEEMSIPLFRFGF